MAGTEPMDLSEKKGGSLCSPLERRMDRVVLPRIPRWLETYHLTWLTLVWCGLIVVFSAKARDDVRWLWLVSAMIALHYVTDHFDGKVGKYRGTGRVATVREFAISLGWFGPTEFRLALIIINALIVRAGTVRMQRALPWVALGGAVALAIEVWRTQRLLWRRDMQMKERTHP